MCPIFLLFHTVHGVLKDRNGMDLTQAEDIKKFSSVHFSRIQLFATPWMPGLPVHHQLPEFSQTHVQWVGDAILRRGGKNTQTNYAKKVFTTQITTMVSSLT